MACNRLRRERWHIVLVHGTRLPLLRWRRYDYRAWKPLLDNLLTRLKSEVHGAPTVHEFRWSGRNSIFARANARRRLFRLVEQQLSTDCSTQYLLVCHSHAGNVGMRAAEALQVLTIGAGGRVHVLCLSTPVLYVPDNDGPRTFPAWAFYIGQALQLSIPLWLYCFGGWSLFSALSVWIAVFIAWITAEACVAYVVEAVSHELRRPYLFLNSVMFIRHPADEATAYLGLGQLASVLGNALNRCLHQIGLLLEPMEQNSWPTRLKTAAAIELTVVAAVGVFTVLMCWWLGTLHDREFFMTSLLLTFAGFHLGIPLLTLAVAVVAFGPIVLAATLAFGLSVGIAAPFLRLVTDVSLPTPRRPFRSWQGDFKHGESLQHSAAYRDVESVAPICSWLESRLDDDWDDDESDS